MGRVGEFEVKGMRESGRTESKCRSRGCCHETVSGAKKSSSERETERGDYAVR